MSAIPARPPNAATTRSRSRCVIPPPSAARCGAMLMGRRVSREIFRQQWKVGQCESAVAALALRYQRSQRVHENFRDTPDRGVIDGRVMTPMDFEAIVTHDADEFDG